MGIGYSVSPLHRVIAMDASAMTTATPEAIVAWRDRLGAKYRDQLEEALTWDEGSAFQASEDVATHGDVMLHYAAAVLDQRGQAGLRQVIQGGNPPQSEFDAVFAEASRRAFGGRFPHILLGATVWLPYKSQLMIEEPNWDSQLTRYGSVYRLADEVSTVRAAITDAGPLLVDATATQTSAPAMVAAWQASATILRLATLAAARHLPLWTTG